MTIWTPDLSTHPGPKYLGIANAIQESISSGELPPQTRLPTHREMAYQLGITVGTVTRGYAEAERRGLVEGEVGRGTFVSGGNKPSLFPFKSAPETPGMVDFTLNFPAKGDQDVQLKRTLTQLSQTADLFPLLEYQPDTGMPHHRQAAAHWISDIGPTVSADQIVVCNGAQHSMFVTFSALCQPGDTIMVEDLTFPGIISLANHLHLRLQGLPIDRDGLIPEAFEAACKTSASRVLYCLPNFQNPTGSVMPVERRRAIAEIARAHDITIVEDDVYASLLTTPLPTIYSMAPEKTYYIASASKNLAPGLRVGYVAAPLEGVQEVASRVRTSGWMASPLNAEITTRWIEDGTAKKLSDWHREEAAIRQRIARNVLEGLDYEGHPAAYHLWLHLPAPWRNETLTEQARKQGVAVIGSEAFAVTKTRAPQAVRICLGSPRTREDVEVGLQCLKEVLMQAPGPNLNII